MSFRTRIRGVLRVLGLVAGGAALVAAAGCGGPERAPRQPITGVDRPADQRAANPYDEPAEAPRPATRQ
ncbi:MAG: hypothetical protein JXQ29_07850 [Planctomycetes bacterium]|nr:hypothetical protein [Planctomycetota bacterium]